MSRYEELLNSVEFEVKRFPYPKEGKVAQVKGTIRVNQRVISIWLKISTEEVKHLPGTGSYIERVKELVELNKEVIKERIRILIDKEEIHFLDQKE